VDLLVVGLSGVFTLVRRENLFESKKMVVLLDDDRRVVSTDYDCQFYKELLCWATQPGQYVLLQPALSGKLRIGQLPPLKVLSKH